MEPVLSSWPINKLREKALNKLMEHIHYEDENSQYICVTAGSKVMSTKDDNSCKFSVSLSIRLHGGKLMMMQ